MAKVFAWMRPNDLIWNYGSTTTCSAGSRRRSTSSTEQRQHAAARGVPRRTARPVQAQPADPPRRAGSQRTAVDLSKVAIDSFHVAGITDHITPWDAVYRSALLLGGQRRFILSNSGTSRASSTHRVKRHENAWY